MRSIEPCRSTTPGRFARCAIAAFLSVSLGADAFAEVKTSTQTRSYGVGGTTAASLVSYMRSHPFRGDHGDAVANIRPYYGLTTATKQTGGTCRASNVTLSIRFVMTLPYARSPSAMGSSTRSAWSSFVAFTRRHEETHKRIYVQCGNTFVAKAQRLTASNCGALNASIRQLLESEKRACDARQRAFDRADYNRVFGLSLFTMARSSSRARR
jgi:predicted secreted Zn-dependent protease